MNNNKKIIFVSIIIIILFAALFLTIRRIDRKSQQDDDVSEIEVDLYFATNDAMYLKPEKRKIEDDGSDFYRNVIDSLIEGPNDSTLRETIPEDVQLIDINIKDELIKVNFNQELIENHWGGSTGERLTVYSIVNTLTQFSELEEVMIMIEGEEQETLVGHMDLSGPLVFNEGIVQK
ncbi:MAG: GerMN domain-containing protein [Halanaerobiales bacterium]